MHWIRRNSGLGSWAALFALMIQLYLSFGHIHLEDFQISSAAIVASSQTQPDNPADDDHGTGGQVVCAICAAVSLTASSPLPSVAALSVPVDHAHTWVVIVPTAQRPHNVLFLFQARAPPRSI
jgi:hypothetical protein